MANRRAGPRYMSCNGRRPKTNRYNPNNPSWAAVHIPYQAFGMNVFRLPPQRRYTPEEPRIIPSKW